MLQLSPGEQFTIVRQLEDHTDSSTNYVQAVIRNAKTDAIIATVNLTDQGNRRFIKTWLVPADVSGLGFWIDILISVYTDAGYTTKNSNYGDKMDTYLIQARPPFNPNYPVPVGGGSDIDYKRIKKIVDASVKSIEIPEPPEIPEPEEIDLKPEFDSIKEQLDKVLDNILSVNRASTKSVIVNIDKLGSLVEKNFADILTEYRKSVTNFVERVNTIGDALDRLSSKNEVDFPTERVNEIKKALREAITNFEGIMNRLESTKFEMQVKNIGVEPVVSTAKDNRINKLLR